MKEKSPLIDTLPIHPALLVFALMRFDSLPQQEIPNSIARCHAFKDISIIGGSNLTIISHPLFPLTNPFGRYHPSTDLDILLNPNYRPFRQPLPAPDFETGPSDGLLDELDTVVHKIANFRLPAVRTSLAQQNRWTCQYTTPYYNLSLCMAPQIELTSTLGWLDRQPVTYLPLTCYSLERWNKVQVHAVWPQGGLSDLKNRVAKIPNPEVFLSGPTTDVSSRILYFAKYAAALPDGSTDNSSLTLCAQTVPALFAQPDNRMHDPQYAALRLQGITEGVVSTEDNNPAAVETFLTLLAAMNYPHNPDQLRAHADKIRPEIIATQTRLSQPALAEYTRYPDPLNTINNCCSETLVTPTNYSPSTAIPPYVFTDPLLSAPQIL
jgi:hypothetical protein